MKLYRLRPFGGGDNLLYILDMIIRSRLHLSTCKYMNDADEGKWGIIENKDGDYLEKARKLRSIIDKTRFTSFLREIDNPLMWAHYAGGFNGIALEYEVDTEKYDLRKINYYGTPFVTINDMDDIICEKLRPQDTGILRQKAKCWEYETEWRLYGETADEYIDNIKPESIIFGVRSSDSNKVLKDIAMKYGLKVGYMNPKSEMSYKISYA